MVGWRRKREKWLKSMIWLSQYVIHAQPRVRYGWCRGLEGGP